MQVRINTCTSSNYDITYNVSVVQLRYSIQITRQVSEALFMFKYTVKSS